MGGKLSAAGELAREGVTSGGATDDDGDALESEGREKLPSTSLLRFVRLRGESPHPTIEKDDKVSTAARFNRRACVGRRISRALRNPLAVGCEEAPSFRVGRVLLNSRDIRASPPPPPPRRRRHRSMC